jgi:hypothetical protein
MSKEDYLEELAKNFDKYEEKYRNLKLELYKIAEMPWYKRIFLREKIFKFIEEEYKSEQKQ